MDNEGIDYKVHISAIAQVGSIYPISISYFDFSIQWPDIIPKTVLEELSHVLFKASFLVLITGGYRLVGTPLASLIFKKNFKVTIIDRQKREKRF